jgi:hypothetical protein
VLSAVHVSEEITSEVTSIFPAKAVPQEIKVNNAVVFIIRLRDEGCRDPEANEVDSPFVESKSKTTMFRFF